MNPSFEELLKDMPKLELHIHLEVLPQLSVLLLFVYLNFASSNCLPQRPYIDLFIIFNLLLVPSTKPLLKLYATAFSTASISRFNPSAKLFSALILLLLYFSTNK